MELSPWDWMELVLGLLFVVCYIVLHLRHLRDPKPSALIGRGPVVSTLWGLGLIAIVLDATLPLPDTAWEPLALGGCLLMLAAIVGSQWSKAGGRDADEDGRASQDPRAPA